MLRLYAILNNPSLINKHDRLVELDQSTVPSVLITDYELTRAVFKSKRVKPYDLLKYWKLVSQVDVMPTIDKLFSTTPFFLHGDSHIRARRDLKAVYAKIEGELDRWVEDWSDNYVSSAPSGISAHDFVSGFIGGVLQNMFIRHVQDDDYDETFDNVPYPAMFQMFPRASELLDLEASFKHRSRQLVHFMERQGRQDELSALLTVITMGQEPLYGALLYGTLSGMDDQCDARKLLGEALPVTVLGRQVVESGEIGGVYFAAGQVINLSPFLCRLTEPAQPSLEFGMGVHLCAGKKIALQITQAFVAAVLRHQPNVNCERVELVRDFVLVLKEFKNG